MVSHSHPRFSDLSYDPCPMPLDSMLRADTYNSMAPIDDERHYCEFTCSECGTNPVERKGMCCYTCRIRILDAAIETEPADDRCPVCGWDGCNDCLLGINPGGAIGTLEVASGN